MGHERLSAWTDLDLRKAIPGFQEIARRYAATEYLCGKFFSESVTVLIDRKAVRPQLTQPFTTTHPPFVFSSQATQLSLGHISI